MKNFILSFCFLLSCQSSLFAMMLSPYEQERRKELKHQHASLLKNKAVIFSATELPAASNRTLTYSTEINAPLFPAARIQINQEEINETVCSTARYVFQCINTYWTYPKLGDDVSIQSPYWAVRWIETSSSYDRKDVTIQAPTLLLMTSPDAIVLALNNIIESENVLECTVALNTVKAFCLKNIMGEENFTNYAVTYYNSLKNKGDFFDTLTSNFITTVKKKSIPGSMGYISNLPHYNYFKPNGAAHGFNIFYVGNDEYLSFGEIWKNGPQSWSAIAQRQCELFCDPNDVEQNHEQHKNCCRSIAQDENQFMQRYTHAQKDSYDFFDANELIKFAKKIK